MKNYLILVYLVLFPFLVHAQVDVMPAWVKQFEGSGSIGGKLITQFDNNQNLYIATSFSGTLDFDLGANVQNLSAPTDDSHIALAKYTNNGVLLWVKTLPCNFHAGVVDLILDASNNLYIAAQFQGTLDADPSANTFNLVPQSPLLSSSMLGKYDSNGNLVWAKHLQGTSNTYIESMLRDASGNIYLTGFFIGTTDFNPDVTAQFNLSTSNNESDGFLTKYDSNGGFLWAKAWVGNGVSNVSSVALDASSNILVGGYFSQTCDMNPNTGTLMLVSSGNRDVFFGKYTALGEPIWVNKLDGTADDYGFVAIDNNDLYVYGLFGSPTIDLDAGVGISLKNNVGTIDNLSVTTFFTKYNLSTGSYTWGNTIGVYFTDFKVRNSNIFIIGGFQGTVDFDANAGVTNLTSPANNPHCFLTKYSTTGVMNYAVSLLGIASVGYGIDFDDNNNIYISSFLKGTGDFDFTSGTSNATANNPNGSMFLAKYAPMFDINVKQAMTNLPSNSTFFAGNMTVNVPKDIVFTIENTGEGTLLINSINAYGNSSLQSAIPTSIPSNSSANVTLRMSASSTGSTWGQLAIASNDPDESPYNIYVTGNVSALAQTITFDALPAKTYNDAPFALNATASSGLAVSYASNNTNVATISGNILTIVGAGTATIIANQNGTSTYSSAPEVSQVLTVNKANQIITFVPIDSKLLGSAPFLLSATSSSGLPISYSTSNVSVATISGNTLTPLLVGNTNISASQSGNNNYNPATAVVQTFQVFPPAPTNLTALPVFPLKVDLTWNVVSNASNYIVYRSSVSGSGFVEIGNVTNNTFADANISNGNVTFYYVVKAVVNSISSNYSNQVSALTTSTENDLDSKSVKISPNPTQDFIIVDFLKPNISNWNFTLQDMAGKILQKGIIEKHTITPKISLLAYPTGTYLLHLQDEAGKQIIKKIIKN